jgi:hypothetical protein
MAGTQSVQADDLRILGIPRSRQTVAIIYPQYSSGLQGFPPPSGQALAEKQGQTPSLSQCSARAAQDIWEHHRPAVGSSMLALCGGHSTSEKQRTEPLGRPRCGPHGPGTDGGRDPHRTTAWEATARTLQSCARLVPVGGRYLTRYRNQPDKSLHQSGAAMHHHPKDQERALNLSIPATS